MFMTKGGQGCTHLNALYASKQHNGDSKDYVASVGDQGGAENEPSGD